MSGLIKTIGSIFNPVLDFFQQIWNFIVFIFSFLWDLVEGLYYGFNTLLSNLWDTLDGILNLSFLSDSSDTFAYLGSLLGITASSLFVGLFLCAVFYVCFKFVWSLLPFFKK